MVTVRAACWLDMPYVRKVRNEPASRRWSSNSERIGMVRHVLWWCSRARARELVYIVLVEGQRAGYVRVRMDSGGWAELSVAVSEVAQGKGAGSEAIRTTVRETSSLAGLRGWRARIDPRNTRSVRAFGAAGFSIAPESPGDGDSWLILERPIV